MAKKSKFQVSTSIVRDSLQAQTSFTVYPFADYSISNFSPNCLNLRMFRNGWLYTIKCLRATSFEYRGTRHRIAFIRIYSSSFAWRERICILDASAVPATADKCAQLNHLTLYGGLFADIKHIPRHYIEIKRFFNCCLALNDMYASITSFIKDRTFYKDDIEVEK